MLARVFDWLTVQKLRNGALTNCSAACSSITYCAKGSESQLAVQVCISPCSACRELARSVIGGRLKKPGDILGLKTRSPDDVALVEVEVKTP